MVTVLALEEDIERPVDLCVGFDLDGGRHLMMSQIADSILWLSTPPQGSHNLVKVGVELLRTTLKSPKVFNVLRQWIHYAENRAIRRWRRTV